MGGGLGDPALDQLGSRFPHPGQPEEAPVGSVSGKQAHPVGVERGGERVGDADPAVVVGGDCLCVNIIVALDFNSTIHSLGVGLDDHALDKLAARVAAVFIVNPAQGDVLRTWEKRALPEIELGGELRTPGDVHRQVMGQLPFSIVEVDYGLITDVVGDDLVAYDLSVRVPAHLYGDLLTLPVSIN